VSAGATAAFTLKPNSGYNATAVTGTCGGTLSGNTYTTKAISANCTVVATFSTSNGSNGGTTPGGAQSGASSSGYVVTTVAGLGPSAMSFINGSPSQATFSYPIGVAVAPDGSLYVADSYNGAIRKIATDGMVSTLAGTGYNGNFTDGPCANAAFGYPSALVTDAAGDIYVGDGLGSADIRKITNPETSSCQVSTLAGSAPKVGYADGMGSSALFNSIGGLAVDASDNVYVTDSANHCIRKVTPAGFVTTVAGACSSNGAGGNVDGPAATAQFSMPWGIAVGQDGTLYVSDKENNNLRKITPDGMVSTWPSNVTFDDARGLAMDADGTLYAVDGQAVVQITPDGQMTTLAGVVVGAGWTDGPAAQARFFDPYDVAIGANGTIYVADQSNNAIRAITPVK
jgi:sugar lactone lactonase YvrE